MVFKSTVTTVNSSAGIITFEGSTMIDCPEKLHTGADLIVSLSIYLLPSAFKRYTSDPSSSSAPARPKFWSNEGSETVEEEMLRRRKASLQQLFEKLGLKPRAGNTMASDKENVPPDGSPQPTVSGNDPTRSKKGLDNVDGAKNNVDSADENDEEVLNENDLDAIYKRCVYS